MLSRVTKFAAEFRETVGVGGGRKAQSFDLNSSNCRNQPLQYKQRSLHLVIEIVCVPKMPYSLTNVIASAKNYVDN